MKINREGLPHGPHNLILVEELEHMISPSGNIRRMGLFKCTCGKDFKSRVRHIEKGLITNCGCGANSGFQKHGLSHTPVRKRWASIKSRCYNPKKPQYEDWGGRGITMYGPWINDPKAFCEYVSALPHFGEYGRSLDRINNDGNYEPGNLRWATRIEQANNTRRNVK
jgi:hypothetical protein